MHTTFVLITTFKKTNALLESLFSGYGKNQQDKQEITVKIEDNSNEDNKNHGTHDFISGESIGKNSEDMAKRQNNSVKNNISIKKINCSREVVLSTNIDNENVHSEEQIDNKPKINIDLRLKDEKLFNNKTVPTMTGFQEEKSSSNEDDNEDTEDMDYTDIIIEESDDKLNVPYEKEITIVVLNGDNVRRRDSLEEKDKLNYSRIEKNERESRTVAKHLRGNINFPFNRTSMKLDGKPLFEQDHICPICKKELQNSDELRKHASSHRILRKYFSRTRMKIPKNVKFVAQPRETFKTSNKEALYTCPFCNLGLTIENFQEHVHSHFSQGDFKCYQCDRVFRKLGHLNSHITVVHKEELPYQCNQCDKGFTVKNSYECHLLTHERSPEQLPHKCDYCDKAFANKQFLRRHMFTHNHERSNWVKKCKICRRTFETFEELKEHQTASDCEPALINLNKRLLKYWIKQNVSKPPVTRELCALCGACVFNLKQHMKQRHTPKDAQQPVKELCSLCGARVLCMKQHMKSHEPKQPVECHICNKKLSSKLTLIKHIRVHTGERPYPCKHCDKRFKDLHTKTVHERTHTGIRRHICSICGKGFLEKAYMLKHMRGVHK